MLTLERGVWARALAQLRDHGAGRNECVVYLTASQDRLDLADQVVHPEHAATPGHYAPTQPWLNTFFAALVRERRSVVAQIHTHWTVAFHSPTDDKYPLVHVPGYISIVVPDFAMRRPALGELYAVEITADGSWQRFEPEQRLSGLE